MGSHLCDQLLILDCAYARKAFSHKAIGRRNFEVLASRANDQRRQSYSFTTQLSDSMHRLLKCSPNGFSTYELYRELDHRKSADKLAGSPYGWRPLHFVLSAPDYGSIWLRPHKLEPKAQTLRNRVFMNVTFALDGYPDGGATNEIARALGNIPHVNQIRFEKIYDPRATLARVVKLVIWMQRWCRKTRKRLHTARPLVIKRRSKVETGLHSKRHGASTPTRSITLIPPQGRSREGRLHWFD